MRLASVGLLLVLAILGCSEAEVTSSDLSGTWVVSSDSRERLPLGLQGASARLSLSNEGTFDAVELPGDLLYVRRPERDQIVSGSGRWGLTGSGLDRRLALDFLRIGAEARSGAFRTELEILATHENVKLYYFSGDPDENRKVLFVKVP